jgi:Na+/H+-dicarboxylate symporter
MSMQAVMLFMRLLEILFFAGVAGSAVVVVISFIEDIHELMGD